MTPLKFEALYQAEWLELEALLDVVLGRKAKGKNTTEAPRGERIAALYRRACEQLALARRADEHGGLSFGPAAKPILKGEERLEIVLPPKRSRKRDRTARDYPHDPLFEALRARRRDLAAEQGVPPYVIFHDSSLREMAELRPGSLAALSRIGGVGAAKLERYGAAFVEVIAGWKEVMIAHRTRRSRLRRRPDAARGHGRDRGAGRHDHRQQPAGRRGAGPAERRRDRRRGRGGRASSIARCRSRAASSPRRSRPWRRSWPMPTAGCCSTAARARARPISGRWRSAAAAFRATR